MHAELAGLKIRAVSVGGFETCIEVPSWKLCFDIGRCPPTAVACSRVLFSHAHVDHMAGVIHHCAQRSLTGRPPPEYWVPEESHEAFLAMMDAWRTLAHSELACTVRAVKPGDRIPLTKDREVHVFRAIHRIPCVGYALVERRKKLKPEYAALPGPEIAAARARGEEITDVKESIAAAFCGDTTIDVIDREELVRKARLLVLEVTFLDEGVSPDKARKNGHVHLDDLVERVDVLDNEVILCTHASRRHQGQVAQLLSERLPSRFVPLLAEAPWI